MLWIVCTKLGICLLVKQFVILMFQVPVSRWIHLATVLGFIMLDKSHSRVWDFDFDIVLVEDHT